MRTFSGIGEFDPQFFDQTAAWGEGNAEELAALVADGLCPRCERPLPIGPELPAGSRVTRCRTIPICGRCGTDEAYEGVYGDGVSDTDRWPITVDEIESRITAVEAYSVVVSGHITDGYLLTDTGVMTVGDRPASGGWAEYGDANA